MPKAARRLSAYFMPVSYLLEKKGDIINLTIAGQKIGPPSRRISLNQSGLKVAGAKVTRFDKHGPAEIEVVRINHLPAISQVRLHAGSIMYPGRYQIELEYKIRPEKLSELSQASKLNRELLPSIDEAEAWQSAEIEFRL